MNDTNFKNPPEHKIVISNFVDLQKSIKNLNIKCSKYSKVWVGGLLFPFDEKDLKSIELDLLSSHIDIEIGLRVKISLPGNRFVNTFIKHPEVCLCQTIMNKLIDRRNNELLDLLKIIPTTTDFDTFSEISKSVGITDENLVHVGVTLASKDDIAQGIYNTSKFSLDDCKNLVTTHITNFTFHENILNLFGENRNTNIFIEYQSNRPVNEITFHPDGYIVSEDEYKVFIKNKFYGGCRDMIEISDSTPRYIQIDF